MAPPPVVQEGDHAVAGVGPGACGVEHPLVEVALVDAPADLAQAGQTAPAGRPSPDPGGLTAPFLLSGGNRAATCRKSSRAPAMNLANRNDTKKHIEMTHSATCITLFMVYNAGRFSRFANRTTYSRPGSRGQLARETVPPPGLVAHCRPNRTGRILQGESEKMLKDSDNSSDKMGRLVRAAMPPASPPPPPTFALV